MTRFSVFYSEKFKNFEEFKKLTGAILYVEQSNGQIKMEFIERNEDLSKYIDYNVINVFNCNFTLHITIKKEN